MENSLSASRGASRVDVGGLSLNYEVVGEGPAVLLLHGWGGCIAAMSPIRENLRRDHTVVSLDLPGFGESQKPAEVWGSEEYARLVEKALAQVGLTEYLAVVGHSFGGKVAIHLALGDVVSMKSLVLVGTPGARLPLSEEAQKRIARAKRMRALANMLPAPLRAIAEKRREQMGSEDYRNAGEMRPILVRVVNEDLRPILSGIKTPTLLLWGANDDAAPVAIANIMEDEIAGSGLVILPKSGHFPYLDEPAAFYAVLRSFLGSMKGEAR